MKIIVAVLVLILPTLACAWDGYDYQKGAFVEIDKGNLVREGQDIEIFDYGTGSYKDVEVQSIQSIGSGAEVEVYDNETGEYRTFDMD
jgi:pyruvate/2-oxoglutarate/acetoin dehydrogenase E1 component